MFSKYTIVSLLFFIVIISCNSDESKQKLDLSDVMKKEIIDKMNEMSAEIGVKTKSLELSVLSYKELTSIGIDSAKLKILQSHIDSYNETINLLEKLDGEWATNEIKSCTDSISSYISRKTEFESKIPTKDDRVIYEALYSMKGVFSNGEEYEEISDTNNVFFNKDVKVIDQSEL